MTRSSLYHPDLSKHKPNEIVREAARHRLPSHENSIMDRGNQGIHDSVDIEIRTHLAALERTNQHGSVADSLLIEVF